MTNTEALEPCRFCEDDDAELTHVLVGALKGKNWMVQCRTCGASGPVKPTRERAITAWNTRTPCPRTVEMCAGVAGQEALGHRDDAAGYEAGIEKAMIKACEMTATRITQAIRALIKDENDG